MAFSKTELGLEYENFNLDWERKVDGNIDIVALPSESRRMPLRYFADKDIQCVATFTKHVALTKEKHFRYLLQFEGFSTILTLYVNGQKVCENYFGYVGFTEDITDFLHDGDNEIVAVVDSKEDPRVPPFGFVIDYLTFSGIYREAHLYKKHENHFSYLHVTWEDTGNLMIEAPSKEGDRIDVRIDDEKYSFFYEPNGKYIIPEYKPKELWSPSSPSLSTIVVSSETDEIQTRFGFRHLSLIDKQLAVNGEKVKILGLDRHQSYPYVGYAGTKNMQVLDARDLKDLGCNAVRTSHYPQSRHFLDACDELGILVFEELPGWQHLGDESWKKNAVSYVEKMIQRDYNHPSIFMWGVRINESPDDHEFYMETNRIAHELDPHRLRGGVRFIYGSELLEDVYTINDFSYQEGKPVDPAELIQGKKELAPMLITEFGGHTYPTKKTDNEKRLIHQTLIHAEVINAARKDNDRMGSFGWCAYDYNTHQQFGSGDKICYHGISDIFRNRKMAAAAYRIQKPIEEEAVLEPLTIWALGERDYSGVVPLHILTNCDYVSAEMPGVNEVFFKEAEPGFEAMNGKVFVVKAMDASWGMAWRDVTFRGYHNGKCVIVKKFLAECVKSDLILDLSDDEIPAHDATRINARLVDQIGNTLHFSNEIVHIETDNCEVLGPSEAALEGGEYAFYVRAYERGKASVKVSCGGYQKEVSFEVL